MQANQHLLLQSWILAERIGSIVISGYILDMTFRLLCRDPASELENLAAQLKLFTTRSQQTFAPKPQGLAKNLKLLNLPKSRLASETVSEARAGNRLRSRSEPLQ